MPTCPQCGVFHCSEGLTYLKGTADRYCEEFNPLKARTEKCSRCRGQLPQKPPKVKLWRWWFGS
jgi:hypothetical protein